MSTSCKESVIIGDFSTGGVINGFSLVDMKMCCHAKSE